MSTSSNNPSVHSIVQLFATLYRDWLDYATPLITVIQGFLSDGAYTHLCSDAGTTGGVIAFVVTDTSGGWAEYNSVGIGHVINIQLTPLCKSLLPQLVDDCTVIPV